VSHKQTKASVSNAESRVEEKPKLVLVTTVALTFKSFFQGQISYLKDKGFEVIAVSSVGQDLEEFAGKEELSAYGITMTRGFSPLADFIAIVRLWMLFLKIKPVIVHGHTPKAGVLSMVAATLANVPIKFYTLHGIMADIRRGPARTLLKLLERSACSLADRVLAVSPSVVDGVVSQGMCPRGKIRVLAYGSCNGIDAIDRFNPSNLDQNEKQHLRSQFRLDEKAIVIGFVGRLVKDKGVEELASAWKLVRNLFHNSRLLMIGPTEPHNPVPTAILDELAGDDRVIILDFVANEDMPVYYGIMDIVALPSYREGFPYVVLEGSAMGLPVVATRVTGCIDAVVGGVTGTLVSPGDVQELAEAIRLYIENPTLRLEHGAAGRELVLANFRPGPIWEALSEEYFSRMNSKGLSFSSLSPGPKSETPSPLSEKGLAS
jgi:glycosyltransferase involved in cell wall biosynthesis